MKQPLGGWAKKIGGLLRDLWLMTGIALLLLIFINVVCHVILARQGRLPASADPALQQDERLGADSYHGVSWAAEYWKESNLCTQVHWTSYTYWRRKAFAGRYINVNEQGLRKTWRSDPAASTGKAKPLKIFVFGGSTVWGTGARDEFTIPSLLAKELSRQKIPAEVTNFGESGYVSTQSVICLIRQIQQNQKPDIVVFYDGVNDTHSAWQQKEPGIPSNEFNRDKEFNILHPTRREELNRIVWREMARDTAVLRLIRNREARSSQPATKTSAIPSRSSASNIKNSEADESLINQLISVYAANIRAVKALGREAGFTPVFYWQPMLISKVNRTTYENGEYEKTDAFRLFYEMTYAKVRLHKALNAEPEFRNISALFDAEKQPLYVDWCHVNEEGNRLIARRMAPDVIKLAGQKRQ